MTTEQIHPGSLAGARRKARLAFSTWPDLSPIRFIDPDGRVTFLLGPDLIPSDVQPWSEP